MVEENFNTEEKVKVKKSNTITNILLFLPILLLNLTKKVGKVFVNIYYFLKNTLLDIYRNPKATFNGFLSAIIPGLGQMRNKQRYKFVIIFSIFILFLLLEVLTGDYLWGIIDITTGYKPDPSGIRFARDYGGIVVKGLWGLITLGEFLVNSVYRGTTLSPNFSNWARPDYSVNLLAEGIIALVFLTIFLIFYILNIKDAYTNRKKIIKGEKLETFKNSMRTLYNEMFSLILMAPAIIIIILFTLVPFIFSFSVAFTDFRTKNLVMAGLEHINWIGFDNFIDVFTGKQSLSRHFPSVLVWTIIYAFMASITVYIIGMINALFVESKYIKRKKLVRIVMIIPWAIPSIVTLMAFRSVFSSNFGLANTLLRDIGLLEPVKYFLIKIKLVGENMTDTDGNLQNISWLTEPKNGNLAKLIVVIVNLWLGWPYFMLLITGVLGTIPKSLYEAASVDGASDFKKFRYITFPWILQATFPVIISTFTFNFNNFGAIYLLTGGGPAQIDAISSKDPGQTDILISWIYKLSFFNEEFSVAAVYSILIFIFIAIFTGWNLSRVKSFWEED